MNGYGIEISEGDTLAGIMGKLVDGADKIGGRVLQLRQVPQTIQR